MASVGYDELRGSHSAFGVSGGGPRRVFDSVVTQGEFRSLSPVTRGGAEIALVTFFTEKPPLPVLVAQPPRRDPIKRELLSAALSNLCGPKVFRLP